jgi:putative phosphoribosyl transferase
VLAASRALVLTITLEIDPLAMISMSRSGRLAVDGGGTRVPPPSEPVRVGSAGLPGDLSLPARAIGIVVFAHGSGSSRKSPRNRGVAQVLHEHRLGTLLFDLLSEQEALDRAQVFDIPMLAGRVADALDWLRARPGTQRMRVGLFGASTGAAAALHAATLRPAQVHAVVSRGGRPDLAASRLPRVTAATLLIVGGLDTEVLQLNRQAMLALNCEKRLEVVPGATHLFEEPGTLDAVAHMAGAWFADHLHDGRAH